MFGVMLKFHWPPCCCHSYACVGSCCPEWSHLSSRSSSLHSGSPVPLHYLDPETEVGIVLKVLWSTNNNNFSLLFISESNRAGVSHLFYKSVVGTIQVEFSQVVTVSKDQVGLLFYTQIPGKKTSSGFSWLWAPSKMQSTHKHALPDVDLQMVGSLGLSSKPSTQRQWKLPCVLMQRWEHG